MIILGKGVGSCSHLSKKLKTKIKWKKKITNCCTGIVNKSSVYSCVHLFSRNNNPHVKSTLRHQRWELRMYIFFALHASRQQKLFPTGLSVLHIPGVDCNLRPITSSPVGAARALRAGCPPRTRSAATGHRYLVQTDSSPSSWEHHEERFHLSADTVSWRPKQTLLLSRPPGTDAADASLA